MGTASKTQLEENLIPDLDYFILKESRLTLQIILTLC